MSVELAAQPASEVTSKGEATSTTQTAQQPLASKYMAELARKEREWRAKDEAFKTREQEWHEKEKSYQEKYLSKDAVKANPLAALQEVGLTTEELLQMAMNPPDTTQLKVQQLEQTIEQLRQSLEERDKKATEQTTQAYQQALKQIENEAKDLVNKSDEFELIKTYGDEGTKAIVKYIEDYFKETKTQMPVAQAAKIIEDYFFEESKKLMSVGKIKSLLGEVTPQDPIEKQQVAPQSGGPKTLTHQGTTTATKPLSPRDRAILAFKGQLNKG